MRFSYLFRMFTVQNKPQLWIVLGLLFLSGLSFGINFLNNDFPFFYHADEHSKLRAILEGDYNFKHPLLMVRVVQLVNYFYGFSDYQHLVELARTVSAVWGVFLVLATYGFSSVILGRARGFCVAAATALMPTIAVHAHYLKEDIPFAACCMVSIFALFRMVQTRRFYFVLGVGLAVGLTYSTKYLGVLLIPIFLLFPRFLPSADRGWYYRQLGWIVGISVIVFFLVNWPMFSQMEQFGEGVKYEVDHVLRGHHLKILPWHHFFSFHFMQSVIPGISLGLAVLALLYLPLMIYRWRNVCWQEKALLVFVLVFYFSVESVPMKAFPGYARYVLPIVPPLLLFAYRFLQEVSLRIFRSKQPWACALFFALALSMPIYQTGMYVYHLNRDTRDDLMDWLAQNPGKTVIEHYLVEADDVFSLAAFRKKKIPSRIKYLVASSFVYGRYFYGAKLDGQKRKVYRRKKFYKRLFKHTVKKINPAFRTFSFSNPTIRIIEVTDELRDELSARRKKKVKTRKRKPMIGDSSVASH